MTEEQKNRMHPGAYKSCLIPYAEAIFTWWYDEQLPGNGNSKTAEKCRDAGQFIHDHTLYKGKGTLGSKTAET